MFFSRLFRLRFEMFMSSRIVQFGSLYYFLFCFLSTAWGCIFWVCLLIFVQKWLFTLISPRYLGNVRGDRAELSLDQRSDEERFFLWGGGGERHPMYNTILLCMLLIYCHVAMRKISHKNYHKMRFEIFFQKCFICIFP